MPRMKILQVVPTYVPAYHYGGPINAVHPLCKTLAQKGLDVTVFTTNIGCERNPDVPTNKYVDLDGVKVVYYPVKFMKPYYYSKELSKSLKKEIPNFDIVHINSIYLYPNFVASYWCKQYKIPYIINSFGALDPDMMKIKGYLKKRLYITLIEKKNIRNASAVHAASLYEKEKVRSCGFDVPIVVVPRGVNISEYEKNNSLKNLKEIYPQLNGKKIILFLGRIHFKKGLDLLAAAFDKIIKKRRDVYLIIAGPSENGYAEEVKKIFGKLNLTKQVLFTGMLLGSQKLSAFYSSDMFVLSSYGENFGLAVLEAMACKLPVVITNRIGLYPDVEEYKAGIITECDSGEIASAVFKLLNNGNLRKCMGENGRRLAEEKFSWDKVANIMIGVYENILGQKS